MLTSHSLLDMCISSVYLCEHFISCLTLPDMCNVHTCLNVSVCGLSPRSAFLIVKYANFKSICINRYSHLHNVKYT